MTHDLDDVLRAALCQDEEIRWKGSPALKPTIKARLPWTLFGLAVAFLPITLGTPSKADLYKVAIYLGFAFFGLRISYTTLIDMLSTKKNLFAVTDQRAISTRALGRTRLCSWSAEKMNILEYTFSSNGHGSVYFRKAASSASWTLRKRLRP